MTFDDAMVAHLLSAQGYDVPAEDVTEIRLRLNDLYQQTRAWDEALPFDVEPWTFKPVVSRVD